ncbi:MAG TPA: DnaJ family domain-containing protein [Prosthecobacter sp.]
MSSLACLAESRIQEALEAGEDRDLRGKGEPMDLDAYFAAPSGLRAGFGLLKSAGVAPPEVEAMREVAFLRERLAAALGTAREEALRKELRTREVELAMGLERMKRALKADAALA